MNWQVFTQLSSIQVQVHWLAAVAAFVLGVLVFGLEKGTNRHKLIGKLYVGAIIVTSMSALFVQNFATEGGMPTFRGFSPIHLLVPFTLGLIGWALYSIRNGNVRAHKYSMIGAYVGGLLIAGAFTFLPGRHMHSLFFGDSNEIEIQIEEGYKK